MKYIASLPWILQVLLIVIGIIVGILLVRPLSLPIFPIGLICFLFGFFVLSCTLIISKEVGRKNIPANDLIFGTPREVVYDAGFVVSGVSFGILLASIFF